MTAGAEGAAQGGFAAQEQAEAAERARAFERERVDVRHTNWVVGAPVATRGGLYELFARDGTGRRLGEWPRSDGRDVERALAAVVAGRAGEAGEREAWAGGAGQDFAAAAPALAAGLGVPPGTVLRAGSALEAWSAGRGPSDALVVHCAARSQGPAALLAEWEELLRRGAALVALPAVEAPLAAALAATRVPRGSAFALVHAPDTGGWERLAAATSPGAALGLRDGGAVVEEAQRYVRGGCFPRPVEGTTRIETRELAAAVRRSCMGFGPAGLGGLAHASCGVVEVAPEHYSAAVELFRAAIATHPGVPTWADPGLAEAYEAAWRGAVDAGACLLAGGDVERVPAGLLLKPTLLVNVPLGSPWAQPGRPLAQVRLVRGG